MVMMADQRVIPGAMATRTPDIRLFVGGQLGWIRGERYDLPGDHMFTAAYPPNKTGLPVLPTLALLDSGAFSDAPADRLTPQAALARQLAWERKASERWEMDWQAYGLVSYDLLIDETWIAGQKQKKRWSVAQAHAAVQVTVDAAAYLASQRHLLMPRVLVLSAQGVDALQYRECAEGVLSVAKPSDWFGLGGWCIIGRVKSMLPIFHQTLWEVLPLVAQAGLKNVHIFGVMWRPALALLWVADRYDLYVSTDSTAPVLNCTRGDSKKAGVKMPYWRDNVKWWQDELAMLRDSRYYRRPPHVAPTRQLDLWPTLGGVR